jgi:manganese transport protein
VRSSDAIPLPAPAAGTGRTRRLRSSLPLLGPAFVAAIAYVDPGNFASQHRRAGRSRERLPTGA